MLVLNHKKLDVWNKSIELVTEIYRITKSFPKEEIFGLSSQLRRASVSVYLTLQKVLLVKVVSKENDFMKSQDHL